MCCVASVDRNSGRALVCLAMVHTQRERKNCPVQVKSNNSLENFGNTEVHLYSLFIRNQFIRNLVYVYDCPGVNEEILLKYPLQRLISNLGVYGGLRHRFRVGRRRKPIASIRLHMYIYLWMGPKIY